MGLLLQLRTQIQQRLQAVAYFADIPILTEEIGDLENEISRALGALTVTGGKLGVCAVVMTARADVRNPNVPGPYLEEIGIAVHVEESVLINQSATGTQKPCSDIAEQVLAALHNWTPVGRGRPIQAAPAGALTVGAPLIGDRAYICSLRTAAGVSATALSTVATPTASPDGGETPATVTLACATAGAAIFYTTDGSDPSPIAGTLYTAPVAVAAAATLKARAYLAGYLDSATKTSVYT